MQLAHLSGFRVATTCGRQNVDAVKALGADVVVDRDDPNVVEKLIAAVGGPLTYAFDCIGAASATIALGALHKEKPAFLHTVAGAPKEIPSNVKHTWGRLGSGLGDAEAELILRKLALHVEALANAGELQPSNFEVLDGGLLAIPKGLQLLSEGKVSRKKLVVRVAH